MTQPKIELFSHRGSPTVAPEHSFEGYDIAIAEGTQYIEQDVHLSLDDKLIVSHDPHFERTASDPRRIIETHSEELQQLFFKNGEHPHILEEVFEHYGQSINYIIETKFNNAKSGDYHGEDILLGLLDQYQLTNQVILQSFHYESLNYMKKRVPQVPMMYLIEKQSVFDKVINNLGDYPDIEIISLSSTLLSASVIQKIKTAGKEPHLFFLKGNENEAIIRQAIEWGIQGIFTDTTAATLAIINEYQ